MGVIGDAPGHGQTRSRKVQYRPDGGTEGTNVVRAATVARNAIIIGANTVISFIQVPFCRHNHSYPLMHYFIFLFTDAIENSACQIFSWTVMWNNPGEE